MTSTTNVKKKLIEVAIPLEAINAASAREKSIRHGHPSTLHLWWARRPLAACRAVLFAQLVDDPSSHPDEFPTHEDQETERRRLFGIIENLVKWENSTNEEVLEIARSEIRKSCGGELPPIYDPFSGGASIPLEAQRLGLPAYGSDLNPVAVTIGKAMVEIPPRFKDADPIHPGIKERQFYRNAEGLAEDVRYYGEWMRKKAWERIGHLYPRVDLPKEHGGGSAAVIAWIWSRTVPSPDPAFANVQVPIASSFLLSAKEGSETWLQPVVDRSAKTISYAVRVGGTKAELDQARDGTKAGRGANFHCLLSGAAITPDYVKGAAKAGRVSQVLMAIVAEGIRSRIYLPASARHIEAASNVDAAYAPTITLPQHSQYVGVLGYGFEDFSDLYTKRQKLALCTFAELATEVREQVLADIAAQQPNGSAEARSERANAIGTYLALAVGKLADISSTLCTWHSGAAHQKIRQTFGRQALPMTWDFAEGNPFSDSSGNFSRQVALISNVLSMALVPSAVGTEVQHDAQTVNYPPNAVISTDPPYYDNIPYADLSDYFYMWLKGPLRSLYPDTFSTISVPKAEELVADRVRHKSADRAEQFFLEGMTNAIRRMREQSSDAAPTTIYYAFKQREIEQEGVSSTGWATFLQAVIDAGFSVVGTWPIRTELANRMRASGSNALANSVVLVCRKKDETAEIITRAEFIRALKREVPPAIAELQAANIAPADMPQSAIGPGMGVFSRYSAVLEADDSRMSVKTALQLINKELDEYLGGIQGEFDADTRFAISWFEQNGMGKGDYGTANNIATARAISVESVKHAGIVESAAGKVRILARDELPEEWDPESDTHLTIWECLQHLVRLHETDGISERAAILLKKIGTRADAKIDLLVIEAGVLLLVGRGRAHEDGTCHPSSCRIAIQIGRRLVDFVWCGRCPINICGDDRLPAHVEIVQQLRLNSGRTHRQATRHDHDGRIAVHPKLVDRLRHKTQHTASTLKFLERTPARVQLIEQLRMDRVGLLQLAPIILVGTALREIIRIVAIELCELLQRVVAVMKLVAGNRFK
jgi:putative DNA methylase